MKETGTTSNARDENGTPGAPETLCGSAPSMSSFEASAKDASGGESSRNASVREEEISSYRSIFKATSVFGGVQIWKILIEIVRQKIIAKLLGTSGVGLIGLYNSALQLIQSVTSMGLSTSAVKDIAEANATGDERRVGRKVSVLRKLVWMTGLLGLVTVLVLSPLLSRTTFGNYDYALPFAFLSLTLLLQQLSAGQTAALQGLRKIQFLAKAGVFGSLAGLLISIPFYYFFGIQGIVPTLILNALAMLLISWWYMSRIALHKVEVSVKESLLEGKEMLRMGLVMTLNSILVTGVSYAVKAFINQRGGPENVGLYVAGFAIVNNYVGLVFTAMSTDYYPRLTSVNHDNVRCRELINQQAEIATLVLAPILCVFLTLTPLAVLILYNRSFLPIVPFMRWAAMGMIFRAASWAISYQLIAKGDMKTFIFNELAANLYILVFNILAYVWDSWTGLGIAYVASNLIYLIQEYVVAHLRYGFCFTASFLSVSVRQMLLLTLCFLAVMLLPSPWNYVAAGALCLLSLVLAWKELNRRMDLAGLLKKVVSRR